MKVIIMIGAAGSGKTHYIKHVLGGDVRVFSADDFFTDARGVYRFEKARLSEAHQECMYQFISAIHNTVIEDQVFVIDNTNVSIEQVARTCRWPEPTEPRSSWCG
jgi:predicted kinase